MLPGRLVRRLTAAGIVVAALAVLVHASSQPPAPGRSLAWGVTPPASAAASPSPVASLAIPSAVPHATAAAGPLAGLQQPLSALWQQLNAGTKASALGEYSILEELGNGLRDRIDSFLRWVTSRH